MKERKSELLSARKNEEGKREKKLPESASTVNRVTKVSKRK